MNNYNGGVLTDGAMLKAINSGEIIIEDFDKSRLNPNSYNLRLGKKILVYKDHILDSRKTNETTEIEIPEDGLLLVPGELYIAETMERTFGGPYVPVLEGRSSIGRLGICVHVTAGWGDIGFDGRWTLEISVIKPVKVYKEMEICQYTLYTPYGECLTPYHGKYQNQEGAVASKIEKDLDEDKGYVDKNSISSEESKKIRFEASDKINEYSNNEKIELYSKESIEAYNNILKLSNSDCCMFYGDSKENVLNRILENGKVNPILLKKYQRILPVAKGGEMSLNSKPFMREFNTQSEDELSNVHFSSKCNIVTPCGKLIECELQNILDNKEITIEYPVMEYQSEANKKAKELLKLLLEEKE